MSVTGQEPVPAGMVTASERSAFSGESSHYDGENPPSARSVPLRELVDDRLLERCSARSAG
jgi:hypothetical protein